MALVGAMKSFPGNAGILPTFGSLRYGKVARTPRNPPPTLTRSELVEGAISLKGMSLASPFERIIRSAAFGFGCRCQLRGFRVLNLGHPALKLLDECGFLGLMLGRAI